MTDPTASEHLAGARTFLGARDRLKGDLPGWAVTATFYSAVHFVRSYLVAHHGVRVGRHDDMHNLWKRHPELRRIKAEYELLKQKSEQFRYYLVDFTEREVDELGRHLSKIRSVVQPWVERDLSKD